MHIRAGNLWAEVDGTDAEIEWLSSYLAVPVKNAEHSDAFQSGHWDGLVRLFDKRRSRFASGLIRLVAGRARESGVAFDLEDVREKPDAPVNPAAGAWLRDYQREALAAILKRGRGIVSMPTGSGKNSVIAAVCEAIHVDWIVAVDTKDLMHDGAAEIARWTKEDVGECGDGIWRPRRITLATLQTLNRGLGKDGRVDALLERARGFISDEVQVLSATESNRVAMACGNAYYRYGLSATPLEREDEADFRAIEATGSMIYELSAQTLIDRGILARPRIFFVEFEHEKMTGTFDEVYGAGVVYNDRRNELISRLASADCSPRPTLVFFKTRDHGPRLERLISRHSTTEAIDGRRNTYSRKHARHRLETGQTDVLLTSRIFNKGVNMVTVESAVNGAAGASVTDAVQKVGRIMRASAGKPVVTFWDILDKRNRWLADHARRRLEAFRGRGYSVSIVSQGDVSVVGRDKDIG